MGQCGSQWDVEWAALQSNQTKCRQQAILDEDQVQAADFVIRNEWVALASVKDAGSV